MVQKKDFKTTEVTIASTETNSTSFKIPDDMLAVGILIPDITDGILYIEGSEDNFSTAGIRVADPATGEDLQIIISGTDPALVDISDYLKFAPTSLDFRFVTENSQGSEQTFKIFFSSL